MTRGELRSNKSVNTDVATAGFAPAATPVTSDVRRHNRTTVSLAESARTCLLAPIPSHRSCIPLCNHIRGSLMQLQATTAAVRKMARITGKPGQSQQLRMALSQLESATRKEPGCVEFAFFQAISDDDSFVLLEHFSDQSAFDLHMKQDHTQDFFSAQLVSSVTAVDVPSLR